MRDRNTLCSSTTARAERLASLFLCFQAPIYCSIQFPVLPHTMPSINSVSYNGTVIPWLQYYTSLQSSWKATELTWRRSRKRRSARRIPSQKSESSTLCIWTQMAAAQDSTGAVVWRSTSVRAIGTLCHPVQPPTKWNFKRSLSTCLGDVNFPLLTSTFPTSFWLLHQPPKWPVMARSFTKRAWPRLWGHQCSSQFLGWLCLYRPSWLGASRLFGSTLKGCAKRWFSNTSREGLPKCWNQYAGCFAGG